MKIPTLICVLGLWSATVAADDLHFGEASTVSSAEPLSRAGRASAPVARARRPRRLHRPTISSRSPATRPVDQTGPDAICRVQLAPRRSRPRRPLVGGLGKARRSRLAYAARYHRAELLYFRGDFAAATAALAALAAADPGHAFANDVLALLSVCEGVRRVRWPHPRSAALNS